MSTTLEKAQPRDLSRFKTLFLIASLYDLILGVVFFFFYGPIFEAFNIALPSNTSYLHLTAGFVFVQGVGYWLVFRNMARNTDIVRLGVVYKGVYCLIAVYYLALGELPSVIFAWFAAFDLLFLLAFVRFLMVASKDVPERIGE